MSTAAPAKTEASAPVKTFQTDSLAVRVYASQAELSSDVARLTQACLRDHVIGGDYRGGQQARALAE